MAYRQNLQGRNPYNEDHYPPQEHRNEFNEGHSSHFNPQYNDSYNDAHYDMYGSRNAYSNQPQHQVYEQGEYNQYTGVTNRDDTDRSTPSAEGDPPAPPSKEGFLNTTAYEHDESTVRPRGRLGNSQKNFGGWGAEGRENLWTRGSRTRTCGRFFCCTVMITMFLIISILLSLALWVRPPNIVVATPVSNGTQSLTLQNGELSFNLGVDITVYNPNYFGVNLKKVELDLTYPIDNYPVGGGVKQNINIRSNSQTNFTFPFSLKYNISDTTGTAVLNDIVAKCNAQQDLTVNYNLKLSLRIIIVSISPTISNSFTFGCPVNSDELKKILGGNL